MTSIERRIARIESGSHPQSNTNWTPEQQAEWQKLATEYRLPVPPGTSQYQITRGAKLLKRAIETNDFSEFRIWRKMLDD